PSTPTSVVAISGDTLVKLSWAVSPSASSYWVYSGSSSGGPFTAIANVTSLGYTNTGLVNGTTNYYVIQATNILGASGLSTAVQGHPNPVITGLTAVGGTGQVALAW